ncbi:MAG: hypothetical protein NVS9B6_08370 [Candidatus Limnocylindrales bacterium]
MLAPVQRDDDAARGTLPPLLDEGQLIEVEHARYDIRVGLRAAFFDVGDTLVENFRPLTATAANARAALEKAFGDRPWFDRFIAADIDPVDDGTFLEQDTTRWMATWFDAEGLACDVDLDALRTASVLPLELVSTPVPGAADAVRWCKANGLAVVLVTNTLYRGNAEVLADWERAGLGPLIDGVVSSHSVGRRKPHPLMFERALELSGVSPAEAVMIGDNPVADIQGAGALGLRTVYRRTALRPLPSDIRPDATVEDLTALPEILHPWL